MRQPTAACLCSWLLLLLPTALAGQEPQAVAKALQQDLLPDTQTLADVKAYVRSRIKRMPQIDTVDQWRVAAQQMREKMLSDVVLRGQGAQWAAAETRVEWLGEIEGGPEYRIRKLRYEALPGLWIPALLYEPHKLPGRAPVVMNVNGHDGKGKAAPYKQIRCINQAKRGMLALNVEWLGMGQLRGDGFVHYRMNQLDLCGTSGLAPFYLSMKRGLDVLLSHEHADPQRVAVTGLSGGGWQTIYISSLDPRVTLCNPVAGYSSFLTRLDHDSDLGDSEQTPVDMATVADYAHLTAMLAPRPALLTYNAEDNCCFASAHALQPLLDAALPAYRKLGHADRLRHHVNHDPGDHNFERDNRQALYAMFNEFFFDGKSSAEEIECESELKTAEQLMVELPDDNSDFHRLAMQLGADLPGQAELPGSRGDANCWRAGRIKALRQTVRYQDYEVKAEQASSEAHDGLHVTTWRLRLGSDWMIPAVELATGETDAATMIVTTGDRAGAAQEAARLLAEGRRVVVVDLFYFGECKIPGRDFLYALLVSTAGQRPLGVQASQIGAVARWLAEQRQQSSVQLLCLDRRASLIGLVATALQRQIDEAELVDSLGSLKQVLEENGAVNKTPEQFCFGLLEQADVKQLLACAVPRPVKLRDPNERARRELAGLAEWYQVFDVEFNPLGEEPKKD